MPEMAVTVVKQGSKVCLAEAWFFFIYMAGKMYKHVSQSRIMFRITPCVFMPWMKEG